MKNKIICGLFIFIVVLPLVLGSEVQSLKKPVKINDCVNLPQSDKDSTFQTLVNVKLPNETLHRIFTNMTKDGPFYSFEFCNTDNLGNYIVGGFSDNETWVYDFDVTMTGIKNAYIIPIFLIGCGLFLLFLGINYRIPILGFASGTLISTAGIFFLIYGIDYFKNFYTDALAYVTLFIGLILSFSSISEYFMK